MSQTVDVETKEGPSTFELAPQTNEGRRKGDIAGKATSLAVEQVPIGTDEDFRKFIAKGEKNDNEVKPRGQTDAAIHNAGNDELAIGRYPSPDKDLDENYIPEETARQEALATKQQGEALADLAAYEANPDPNK